MYIVCQLPKHVQVNIAKKGNIEPKGISWAGLASR